MDVKRFAVLGALLALTAVMLGAFGAHALKEVLSEYALSVYRTAVDYQIWHALGLLSIGAIGIQNVSVSAEVWFKRTGYLMLFGVLVFCGSLYALSLSGLKWLGAITPIGGLAFILAWACFIVGLIKLELRQERT